MIKYRPELDGLRALAVLGVFLYHLDLEFAKGGWLGVDIFFVLSGYLISSILIREVESTGSVSFSYFYMRRTRRILPALIVCLIGIFPCALLFSNTSFFYEFLQSAVAAFFSVSNIYFWQKAGYFGNEAKFTLLLHTWTLGIEEQFYIIVPAFFALIAKLKGRGRIIAWTVFSISVMISFLACRFGRAFIPTDFNFYMLPTRMWELAIGTFTALVANRYSIKFTSKTLFRELIGILGGSFLLFAFATYNGGSYFAEKSLFVCLATVAIILAVGHKGVLGTILSWHPLRYIGQISYSLYLWHWPIIVLITALSLKYSIALNPFLKTILALSLTTCLASLSLKFVERPFRSLNRWSTISYKIAPYAVVVACCYLFGFTFLGGEQPTQKLDSRIFAESSYEDVIAGDLIPLGGTEGESFILLGDSHARAVAFALDEMAKEYGVSGRVATHSSTPPLNSDTYPRWKDTDPPYGKAWFQHIVNRDIKHVVLAARWTGYKHIDKESGDYLLNLELKKTVNFLLNQGRHVWLLETVPAYDDNPVFMSRLVKDYKFKAQTSQRERVAFNALIGIDNPMLHFLDPWPLLIKNGYILLEDNGYLLYRDQHHLSPQGSMKLKKLFKPLFEFTSSENKLASD